MTEYYVSTSGNDDNPGTFTQPFRTIAKGVSKLKDPGDILTLRQGVYFESVDIARKKGKKNENDGTINYITIRSYRNEHAVIDGSVLQTLGENSGWQPAQCFDQNALKDEYVSQATFPEGLTKEEKVVNRGAFLDSSSHKRLITYSKLNDLRAKNETFEKITDPNDQREGPQVTDKQGTQLGYRHPWVYMGPGIWFNKDSNSPTAGRVHIRLAHTHNNICGLADYTGETDPRKVRLAIAPQDRVTLFVRASEYVRFENLTIRHGGEYSLYLTETTGIVFDHVRIWASSYGVRMGKVKDTSFSHCEFNGGLPTWFFRNDGKHSYYYIDGDEIPQNNLGQQTLQTLLLGSNKDRGTEIHHCEFINGHDLHLVGTNLKFYHNWINNLNDDGMFLDAYLTDNIQIYQNVITKCLSALSFASEDPKNIGGPRYIYRNLFDLRDPTAGYRPRNPNQTREEREEEVWRYGQLYKGSAPDGPLDLFQNTFLVYGQTEQASYMHYRSTDAKSGNHPRRSFNNIFVAVNPDEKSDKPITFVPSPGFPAQTDGNCYYRIGYATKPLFRSLEYCFKDDPPCPQVPINPQPATPPCPEGRKCGPGTFADLVALRGGPDREPSLLFRQSKSQYLPGYEANSIEQNPKFRRIDDDGHFRESDDLRLCSDSPAKGTGVTVPLLPNDLKELDPFAPPSGNPDIGCYPLEGAGSGPLQVGIDSRRSYPSN